MACLLENHLGDIFFVVNWCVTILHFNFSGQKQRGNMKVLISIIYRSEEKKICITCLTLSRTSSQDFSFQFCYAGAFQTRINALIESKFCN